MAEIVLGLGTPHSPLASLPGKFWKMQGDNEMRNPGPIRVAYGGGEVEELRKIREPILKDQITEEAQEAKFQRAQVGVASLRKYLAEARVDVLVTIADDQQNLFFFDCMPAFAIYKGETIKNYKPDPNRQVPEYSLPPAGVPVPSMPTRSILLIPSWRCTWSSRSSRRSSTLPTCRSPVMAGNGLVASPL